MSETEVEFEKIVTKTPKAILIRTSDGREEWIPFSQILDLKTDNDKKDSPGVVTIPQWLAKSKDLD